MSTIGRNESPQTGAEPLTLARPISAREVLDSVGEWLVLSEPRHQFLLGALQRMASAKNRSEGGRERYFATLRRSGRPCGAVVKTAASLVVSRLPQSGLEALAADIDREFRELPVIFGPEASAWRLGEALAARRGGEPSWRLRSTLYLLGDLKPPHPPVPGLLRRLSLEDAPRAEAWLEAFRLEAMPASLKTAPLARRLIKGGDLYFWSIYGDDVAIGGVAGRSPRGVRIGWMYTPPEMRKKGYASALISRLSRRLLEEGAGFCCLYADLSNPASNRLYRRLGYREIESAAEVIVGPPGADAR